MPPNPEFSDRLFGMSPAERGSFLLLSVQFIFGQSIKSLEPRTEENRVWERDRDRRKSRAGENASPRWVQYHTDIEKLTPN